MPRGGDGQRPLARLLPADIGEVHAVATFGAEDLFEVHAGRLDGQLLREEAHRVGQRPRMFRVWVSCSPSA